MKYFTINELCDSVIAKNHGIDNTPTDDIIEHLTELTENILDPLRKAWGSPIVTNSGYRCEKVNALAGGSKTSAHCTGYAADVHPLSYKNKEFLEFAKKFLADNNIPYDQLINEYPDKNGTPSWIHIGYKNRNGLQRRQNLTLK